MIHPCEELVEDTNSQIPEKQEVKRRAVFSTKEEAEERTRLRM